MKYSPKEQQAKQSQTQPHPPSPDRSQPTILELVELSRECRRLFDAAKIEGGPAWDRFFDADKLLQRAFDDGKTPQGDAPQNGSEGEAEPDHVLRSEVPKPVRRNIRTRTRSQQGPHRHKDASGLR